MIAVEIKCVDTGWRRVCVGDGMKESPLYEHDEWVNDRPASFGFNAEGELVAYQFGQVLLAAPVYRFDRATLPEWAKKHKRAATAEATPAQEPPKPEEKAAAGIPRAGLWTLVRRKDGREEIVAEGSRPSCYIKAAKLGVEKPTSKEWRTAGDAEYILRAAKTLFEQYNEEAKHGA